MRDVRLQPFAPIRPSGLPPVEVEGLYVHVPFCFHKCHYCDFYSITRQTEERMARFVELMLREAELWSAARAGPTPRPRTVFFGGGTPSLLPLELMRRLIEGLRERFDCSAGRGMDRRVQPRHRASGVLPRCCGSPASIG